MKHTKLTIVITLVLSLILLFAVSCDGNAGGNANTPSSEGGKGENNPSNPGTEEGGEKASAYKDYIPTNMPEKVRGIFNKYVSDYGKMKVAHCFDGAPEVNTTAADIDKINESRKGVNPVGEEFAVFFPGESNSTIDGLYNEGDGNKSKEKGYTLITLNNTVLENGLTGKRLNLWGYWFSDDTQGFVELICKDENSLIYRVSTNNDGSASINGVNVNVVC